MARTESSGGNGEFAAVSAERRVGRPDLAGALRDVVVATEALSAATVSSTATVSSIPVVSDAVVSAVPSSRTRHAASTATVNAAIASSAIVIRIANLAKP
jgi:hypothetical protein